MPQPPNLQKMLAEAQAMLAAQQEAQEKLKEQKVDATAGGGMVRVEMTGDLRIESLVIDNDIIGAAQRTIRGIRVDDEALSLETIRKTCLEGPGHFLGAEQTLRLMQTEYVYPAVGDRMSPKEWAEQSKPGYIDRAVKQTRAILGRHFPSHVPDAVDQQIRARWPVKLPKDAMGRAA